MASALQTSLHQRASVDTLPSDLKEIAHRLIARKFPAPKKKPEPEVMEGYQYKHAQDVRGAYDPGRVAIRYRVNPIMPSEHYYGRMADKPLPHDMVIHHDPTQDPATAVEQIKYYEHKMEAEYGVKVRLTREQYDQERMNIRPNQYFGGINF